MSPPLENVASQYILWITRHTGDFLTQQSSIPVLLGHPGDHNLASLVNDGI